MSVDINFNVNVTSSGDSKLDKILALLEKLMSAISDYVAKQKEFNDATGQAVGSIGVSLTGLTGDIAGLNQKITDLQNNPGPISPEDQALLDGLQGDGAALAAKAKAASDALAALDAITPPVAPSPQDLNPK